VIYDRLRSIGVSVETADALAPILETMPERKQEAFILWAMGYSYRDAGKACGFSYEVVKRIIKKCKKVLTK
jgi:DNA-directed RNA polymerase specialized sigma24 family protein